MTTVEHGSDVNLEDLRGQLAGRLGAALMVASVALIWVNWPQESFPFLGVVPLAALLGLGWGVHKLVDVCPAVARHLLVWSLTAGLLAAIWLFPAPWLPFLGLPLTFVSAMLVSGGGHFDKNAYLSEEVLRIPMVMRWPGQLSAGEVNQGLISNLDLP